MKRSFAYWSHTIPSRWLGVWTLMGAACGVAQATCNASVSQTRPDSRYELLAGATPTGSEVRDKVTGLVWQRCVLGMAWSGTTCTGTASSLTWQNALDAARTATASTVAGAGTWRLPNHVELYSLTELACYNPAINSTWFPATPSSGAWSSSPSSSYNAWVINFNNLYGGVTNKSGALTVRLVRSGQ